jgi:hypothetical protein
MLRIAFLHDFLATGDVHEVREADRNTSGSFQADDLEYYNSCAYELNDLTDSCPPSYLDTPQRVRGITSEPRYPSV